jgi:ABC-type uncharacterized transport system involved in gliding motility auxiliary subunit
MTKRQALIISVLSLIALILGMLISRRIWFRLDLTENKAYTISPVSRNLYREIPDQVHITYYLSEKLASIHPVPGEIEDLLREYTAYSRGKIRLSLRDPLKAGLVREVEQLGISPQQIQTVEEDQSSIATVYTGIVIEYLDKTEVIPFAFYPDTLEYDLTSRIRSLVRGTRREIGVLIGDSGKQWTTDYNFVNQSFTGSGFQIRLLTAGEEIPDTLPALLVLGGAESLDDWALYRIDRYIRGGGKAIFALEGVLVDQNSGLEARVMTDQGLLAMVSSYGATVKPELVLDPSALSLSYQTMDPYGSMAFRVVRYPLWIGVLGQNGSQGHPVTAGFGGVDLYWASPVELNPPAGVEAEPLFTSTPEAWLMTRDFSANPEMGYLFEQERPDTQGPKILGAALSGKFPGWFAGMPKPIREGAAEELPDMPAEAKDSRIIVVGDVDFASTLIQYTRSDRNLDFLLKAADWLGNDDDIIGIRRRVSNAGRLDKITDPAARLRAMRFARVLNVGIIPLAVIVLGVLRAWRRRRSVSAPRAKEKEISDGV